MWIHDVKLEKYQALVPGGGPLRLGTSESQGNEQLRITLGDGWEGLTVRVIFRPCKITKMVPEDGMVDVPWEATRNPLTAAKGKIVFRGLSDDGRIINTLDLPYCVEGHSPTSGQEENQYTPGLVDQLVQQVKEDSQAARQAAKDADAAQEVAAKNADAAAKSSENAAASAQEAKETAAGIESQTKKYADAAAASAQEAKETAAGIESQTKKYADAAAASAQAAENSAAKAEAAADELGQIVKDGPVMSVNGQTGRVNLAAANLPFDNAGTPFVSTTVQDAIEELLMIGGGGSAVSMIRITAPAGAVVTIKNGAKVYTQTVGSDGADLSFMVLETGSWQVSGIWNDLQDSATVNVAEAGGTYSAVLDFAPFRAYIHVVARSGAVVTAAKGEQMVSDTVVGSDVTLTVSDKGQWTLSAVYDGGNAVPVVVDVQEEKATYEAELHFLVLTVTAPAGAEVTAAKDGDTIRKTAEAGTVDLYLTGPGLWTVSSAYDGAASQQVTVEVNAGQDTYTAEPAFATLEVTAPAGSSIKAQNGQTILTKTADTGSVLFYLPALGTWDLTATLNGQTATSSVDCAAYQDYSTELAFFSATIKTTAVDGATVKAVMGDYSVSGKAGTDGTATLTVLKPGSYTVSASYSGASSNSKSVDVSKSGQQYTVSVEFITLTVTAPEGSTITVKNNVTELTDTGGTVKFYLPNTGSWTITAELDGQTASDSVECYAYQAYSTSLSYFSATIKVTAVQGATVKAVLDGHTVSGEAGSGGVVTLTVLHPGSYTVSATYKNALSNSKAVQVSQSGQEYPVSVEFITLTVTAPAGSTITAKNGATTLTDTGGTVKFYLPNTGSWTVSASLGSDSTSDSIQCNAYQNYSVELSYAPPENMNDATWEVLHKYSATGQLSNYYDVGDGKDVTLNGTVGSLKLTNFVIMAFIMGFNHNASLEGSNKTHFALGKISGKMVAFCDSKYDSETSSTAFHMNSSATNSGGWASSYMRKTVLGNSSTPSSPSSNSLMAALPSDLRAVMQPVTKYTNNKGKSTSSSAVTSTVDYLWIPSEFEWFGDIMYGNTYEKNKQKQYDYFVSGNSWNVCKHSSVNTYADIWSRSATEDWGEYFVRLESGEYISQGLRNANLSQGLFSLFAI